MHYIYVSLLLLNQREEERALERRIAKAQAAEPVSGDKHAHESRKDPPTDQNHENLERKRKLVSAVQTAESRFVAHNLKVCGCCSHAFFIIC